MDGSLQYVDATVLSGYACVWGDVCYPGESSGIWSAIGISRGRSPLVADAACWLREQRLHASAMEDEQLNARVRP
jgi:hypothetical protein